MVKRPWLDEQYISLNDATVVTLCDKSNFFVNISTDKCLQLSTLVRGSPLCSAQQQMHSLIISKCWSDPKCSFLNGTCRLTIPPRHREHHGSGSWMSCLGVRRTAVTCCLWTWPSHCSLKKSCDHLQLQVIMFTTDCEHLCWTGQLEEIACWWKKMPPKP